LAARGIPQKLLRHRDTKAVIVFITGHLTQLVAVVGRELLVQTHLQIHKLETVEMAYQTQ
jgi:hypothetical protein